MNQLSQISNLIVSSEEEPLILVDESDGQIGTLTKAACHDGDGVLHRAFSLFLFNDQGKLLLQQRSAQKRLWPLYWSNSCCSHPRSGETMTIAVNRRLQQELGVRSRFEFLFKFQYQAAYEAMGAERELCWVYFGRCEGKLVVNINEIADWRYVSVEELEEELKQYPEHFTPWFRLEWASIQKEFPSKVKEYSDSENSVA